MGLVKAAGLHAQAKSEGAVSSAAAGAGPHLTAGRILVPLLADCAGTAAGRLQDPSLLKKLMRAPKSEAARLALADGLRVCSLADAAGNGIAGKASVSSADGVST